jgi:nitroreductase
VLFAKGPHDPYKAAMRSMELMMSYITPRVELGRSARHARPREATRNIWGERNMEIGASILAPTELAVALEERGFDSLWVAEHSDIPVIRRFTHPLGDAADAFQSRRGGRRNGRLPRAASSGPRDWPRSGSR